MSKINPAAIFVNNEIIRQIQEQLEIARAEITELQEKVAGFGSASGRIGGEVEVPPTAFKRARSSKSE